MRWIAAFCASTLACASAHADQPPAHPRPVIENTYVSVPHDIGSYALRGSTNYADKGDPRAGIGMKWTDRNDPALNADLFVYPIGESATDDDMVREFRDGIDQVQRAGLFQRVSWGESETRTVMHADGTPWRGRVLSMTAVLKSGHAVISRTYLFHEGLYAYKLRADLPIERASDLPADANAMAGELLGAVRVVSVGSCGQQLQVRIIKDTDPAPATSVADTGAGDPVSADGFAVTIRQSQLESGPKSALQSPAAAKLLEQAAARQVAHGCTALPYDPPADMTTLTIHYPADFWRAGSDNPKG